MISRVSGSVFRIPRPSLLVSLSLGLLFGGAAEMGAQEPNGDDPRSRFAIEDYLEPPPEIMDAVLAPRHENVTLRNLDPSGRYFLNTISDGFPSLAIFAKPHLNLGAWQVDPAADRSRRLTTRSDVGYEVIPGDGGERVRLEVPEDARVSGAEWSPDGSRVAFFAHFDDRTHIYVADAEDGDSRQVTRDPVLATMVTGFEWTQDGREIVTVLPPEDRGGPPVKPEVPETPMVRVTTDVPNRLRTYFDLLEDPYEKALVEYYGTGQLATIEVDSRDVSRIGEPAMITGVDVSPDGQYFRVETMQPPFPYIVPTTSAGSREELWDREGNVLAVLEENEARTGAQDDDDDEEEDEEEEKRGLTWRVDGGPGMVFLQMEPRPDEDEADDATDEEQEEQASSGRRQDRVMYWLPPFDPTSTELVYETPRRMAGVSFDDTGQILFITRRAGNGPGGGGARVSAVYLDEPDEEFELYRGSGDDITDDPGSLVYTTGSSGQRVVRTVENGSVVFLEGTQYYENPNENAPRPFLDRLTIRSGDKERVWQSAEDVYEQILVALDDDMTELIVQRESPTTIPDSWRVNLETGESEQLTTNVDHTPDITAARRERIMIERPDGFTSKVEVTLPADYRDGAPLPAMFWFYPREYSEQEQYEERNLQRYNKNDFPGVGSRSMEILTRLGYAVVDPDLPIVGENGQMNDNYVQDLRTTLRVVIDSVAARGWVDRQRLGIGGHSYGAFGTANAMVNTSFFRAGIAGDGNYNRSLTPAGFQSERRMLWEADQVYIEMSPFFNADRLNGALLMYHGMDDHNVGTHPTHSRRLFHALNVLGKTAALYMYPFEDHGPATRETTLDLWARWTTWLDHYVKNAGRTDRVTTEDDGAGSF